MNITWDTDVYCLIGHPISKSLSPIIHNNFYKLIGKNNVYITFDVEEEGLETVVKTFKTLDIKGFNVTLPHKIKIMKYLDNISEEAKTIGAVNTVKNQNGILTGYNTDATGFLKSLETKKIDVKGMNILILGSGGAANAIAMSISMAGASKVYINNRKIQKAELLSKKIKSYFSQIEVEYGDLNLNNISKPDIDIIINCTSVGMYPSTDYMPINLEGFSKDLIVADIIYKPIKTKFLQLAEQKGYTTVGGLSMLINQALYSQQIWFGNDDKNIFNYFKEIEGILYTFVE